MIVPLRHLLGWIVSSFRSLEDLALENLALRRQLLVLPSQRPALDYCPAQAVLGCVENVLVWVEEASRLGYSPNRRELGSSRVSFVLDMDLKIPTSRRSQACQQKLRALIFRMVAENPRIRPGERCAFTGNCGWETA